MSSLAVCRHSSSCTFSFLTLVWLQVPGAIEALLALGWVIDEAEPDFLVAPKSYRPSMADVRDLPPTTADLGTC